MRIAACTASRQFPPQSNYDEEKAYFDLHFTVQQQLLTITTTTTTTYTDMDTTAALKLGTGATGAGAGTATTTATTTTASTNSSTTLLLLQSTGCGGWADLASGGVLVLQFFELELCRGGVVGLARLTVAQTRQGKAHSTQWVLLYNTMVVTSEVEQTL